VHHNVLVQLERFIRTLGGNKTWEEIQSRVDEAEGPPDADTEHLIRQTLLIGPAFLGQASGLFLRRFGRFFVREAIQAFPGVIHPDWTALDLIEHAPEVVSRAAGQQQGQSAPVLRTRRTGPDTVIVTYASTRRLCGFTEGIMKGIVGLYEEPIDIIETECAKKGAPACVFRVARVGS